MVLVVSVLQVQDTPILALLRVGKDWSEER